MSSSLAVKAVSKDAEEIYVKRLGSGGMGRVDLVIRRSGTFERLCAVKRARAGLAEDDDVREMFLFEGQLAGKIRHPHIVSVHEVGEDDDGLFMVMDFVDGVSLSRLAKRQQDAGEPIPIQLALRIVTQIAEGLTAAHALDIIHRDVSPQNILLGFDGLARLTDFGIAKAIGASSRTRTGFMKGKLGYLAPEQLQFIEPTPRTDIFALGIVLFELLANDRLYAGGEKGAKKMLHEPAPDVRTHRPEVPAELAELLLRMLAKTQDERPESTKEVARRLDRFLAELVASEGRLDLASYLEERFGNDKDALAAEVDAARTNPEREDTAETVAARPSSPSTSRSRVVRRSSSTPIVIGVLIALAGVAVGLGLAFGGAGSDSAAVEEPAPAPDPAPPPEEEQPETVAAETPTDDVPRAADTTDPEPAEAAESSAEADEDQENAAQSGQRPRMRPVRRGMRRRHDRGTMTAEMTVSNDSDRSAMWW